MKEILKKILKYIHRKERIISETNESPLPDDYKNKEQSLTFQKANIIFPAIDRLVYAGDIIGISRNLKICEVESYVSVFEPIVKRSTCPKIVLWQPTIDKNKISGWHVNLFGLTSYQSGIAVVENGEYWQKWSHHARRHRKKYLQDQSYEIITIDLPSFINAYEKCGKLDFVTRAMFIRGLRINDRNHKERMCLYAARRKEDKKIFAGLAVVDHPDISMSRNYISFINKEEKNTSAGYGLVDFWFQDCLKKGIRFPNFGIIWKKGDPHSWRGYSQFKKQFNIHIIRYPRPFFKIVF